MACAGPLGSPPHALRNVRLRQWRSLLQGRVYQKQLCRFRHRHAFQKLLQIGVHRSAQSCAVARALEPAALQIRRQASPGPGLAATSGFRESLAGLLQINAFSARPIIRMLGEVEMSKTAETRLIVRMLLVSCVAGSSMFATPASAQDLQAYCAKVGDDDRVQPVPDALLPNARRMFDVPANTAASHIKATTSVRCMNGAVWLCNHGANLNCGKADVSRNSPGADRFCKQNPDSIGVPMSATGHATVYDWKCVGREARIIGPILQIDGRGFMAGNWKQLE